MADVGKMLQEVPIGDMIVGYARGIADAQWELDMKSIEMLKIMANEKIKVPNKAKNDELEEKSLLELGFLPTFYHFEEAVIEVSVSLTMHEEQSFNIDVGFQGQQSNTRNTQRTGRGGGAGGTGGSGGGSGSASTP